LEGERVVLDASVVVKWFVVEEGREEALAIRDDYIDGRVSICAPHLMLFEVLNAVRYARRDLEPSTLRAIARSLALYGFDLYPLAGEYAELTAEVALRNGITVYDASYVALARLLGATMYTADEKLIALLSEEDRAYVAHLSEYSSARRQSDGR